MKTIELKNVTKVYKLKRKDNSFFFIQNSQTEDFRVLENITLKIRKGECVGIIGENGSGKTTLLKLIGDLIQPSSGEIIRNGSIQCFLDLSTGMQNELTGKENIYLYGSLLGIPKKELKEKIDDIIDYAGLRKFIDVKLKNYSSGMKVRLAFSVAMAQKPDIILIDEVMAVGDEAFQKKSFNQIKLLKEKGKTIVLVSHNLDLITDICNRVIYLENGRIVKQGPPKKVVFQYLKKVSKDNHVKISDNTKQDRKDRIEDIRISCKILQKDIDVMEQELSNKIEEEYVSTILSLIKKLIELKELNISLESNTIVKINLFEDIINLRNKQLTYTFELRKKKKIYNKIAEALLQILSMDNNPYMVPKRIQDFMDIYPQLDWSKKDLKKFVSSFLKSTTLPKVINTMNDAVLYYHKTCLRYQLNKKNNEELSANLKKLKQVLHTYSDKKWVFNFIFMELKDRLNNEGYNLKLKSQILLTFFDVIKKSNKKLTKTQVSQIENTTTSLFDQIHKKIILLSHEKQFNLKKELNDFKIIIMKKKSEILKKSHKRIIKKVYTTDPNGNKKNVFSSGDDVVINIEYNLKETVSNPVFGVALFTEERYYIAGPNTKFDNLRLGQVKGRGRIKYIIKNIPLLSGTYYISVSIHPEESFNEYDYFDKGAYFMIKNTKKEFGVISLKSRWEHNNE
ncbi:MAG: ABC transporter ATP-binding protein [Candidatus Heimdallarchaeaceae archaeon]